MLKKIKDKIPSPIRKKISDLYFGKSVEEVELVFDFFKKENHTGTMVDVGAHFGTSLLPFAKKDWKIFAFEPDKKNREHLVKTIENLPNVHLDTRAVSNSDGEKVSFFSSDVSTGISGLSSFHPSHKPTDTVTTVTLKTFCENNNIKDISFLKIDTEGFDLFVLKGFDWDNQKHPDVIVTEFENNKTLPLGYSFFDQADFLQQQNYKLISSEWFPIVEYGRRHKWKRFVTDYKKITDKDAWGNIIAIKENKFEKLVNLAKKIGPIE